MQLRRHHLFAAILIGLGVLFFFSCSRWLKPTAPRLAVVIVVDQMRYDYLVRFAGLYSGGLAKLVREGAVFTNAHHDHAGTETAPGHATLSTGSYPSHHGIVGNSWYDRQSRRNVYCVDDTAAALVASGDKNNLSVPAKASAGKSPRTMLRHTLGDWLKAKYPHAKVLSVSGKDRSAIVMAGFDADAAYWFYAPRGGFVSSRYYLEALPEWAAKWNAERHADRYYGQAWEKSRPETDYFVSREDLFSAEGDGIHTTFPHQFVTKEIGTNSPAVDSSGKPAIHHKFYDWLSNTPFVDVLTLEFAQQAIKSEALGADNVPDLILISLKATDVVGHQFGPLSQESEDNLLRVDAELARFFAFLDTQVGLKKCLIALTADHGVLPLPEELRRRGFEAARILEDEAKNEIAAVQAEMQQQWRTQRRILRNTGGDLNLDYHVADSLGWSHADFRARVAEKLRTLSFVSDVFTYDELQASDRSDRKYIDKQRHSFHPERAPDLTIQLKPYYLVSDDPHGTTHGSPYEYDTHVPIILWGTRIKPGRIDSPHKTVDLAPTLAQLLNLDLSADLQRRADSNRSIPERVEFGADGQILTMVIKE